MADVFVQGAGPAEKHDILMLYIVFALEQNLGGSLTLKTDTLTFQSSDSGLKQCN